MRKRQKTKGLRFQTAVDEKRAKTRKLWLAFAFGVLLVALASVLVFLNSTGRLDPGTNRLEKTVQKEVTILIASADSNEHLRALGWLTVDTKHNELTVTTVSPLEKYKGATFADLYKEDEASAEQLKEAVSKKCNVDIDKYMLIPESSYPRLLNCLGNYTVNLATEISYDGDDYSLHILPGERTVTGAVFFDYLNYIGGTFQKDEVEAQANLLADYLRQVSTLNNGRQAQSEFEFLCNNMITDIAATDFARYANFALEYTSQKNPVVEVKQ